MAGSVRITNVNGISTVVDITTTGGSPTEFTAYSDLACTQTVALPATITADTTFYVKATGTVLLSVTVDGIEIAGPASVALSNAGPVTFSLDPDPRNNGQILGLVATHGGSSAVPTAKTADYTAKNGDAVLADASGGDFSVTLPAPTSADSVTVKNVGNTGNVTVLPHASETIDGMSTALLGSPNLSRTFLADGTNWWVI